jgi:hypothetical protein
VIGFENARVRPTRPAGLPVTTQPLAPVGHSSLSLKAAAGTWAIRQELGALGLEEGDRLERERLDFGPA